METHTFIARSAEEAVRQISAQLGPHAVVVNVRKLPRPKFPRLWPRVRYEVTATVQPPAPAIPLEPLGEIRAQLRQVQDHLSQLTLPGSFLAPMLVQSGMLPRFAQELAAEPEVPPDASLQEQIESLRQCLRARWTPCGPSLATHHVFVGAPGSGKSTVLCKWLSQQILAENRGAGVYQLDAHIANLSPQPRRFTEILGAHFARSADRPFEAESYFIDLPGVDCGDHPNLEALRESIAAFPGASIHLVLNGAYDSSLLLDQVRFFGVLDPEDLILTHMDEERRWGKAWNLILGSSYRIRFFSAGQNIPGALVPAEPDSVLARQFGGKPVDFRGF